MVVFGYQCPVHKKTVLVENSDPVPTCAELEDCSFEDHRGGSGFSTCGRPLSPIGGSMKNILITGGPVHAHLDSVKIITNAFKGGRMLELAYGLEKYVGDPVSYLGAKHVLKDQLGSLANLIDVPNTTHSPGPGDGGGVRFISHTGFDSYRKKVLELAPEMDVVILGAAVANLIPASPWKDKFPSHDWKVGDVLNIPFRIAPRIIDEVRAVMKPHALLIGFKLLDDVSADTLWSAAKQVLKGSRANFVIANDRQRLDKKLIATPEDGCFWLEGSLVDWLRARIYDQHYTTTLVDSELDPNVADSAGYAFRLLEHPLAKFTQPEPHGHIHGAVAVARRQGGFVCSARGKKTIREMTVVVSVDHNKRVVTTRGPKASLAAPLFDRLFANQPKAHAIIHSHRTADLELPVLPYAPAGTLADANREVARSFRVEGHGAFILLDAAGEVLR